MDTSGYLGKVNCGNLDATLTLHSVTRSSCSSVCICRFPSQKTTASDIQLVNIKTVKISDRSDSVIYKMLGLTMLAGLPG